MVNEFKLERLNSAGVVQQGIKFHFASGIDDSIMFNNVSMPSAGQDSNSNFAVNFGVKRLFKIDFILANDGTDKSVTGLSVVTLTQQWKYLMGDPVTYASNSVVQGFVANQQYKTKFKCTIYSDGTTWTLTGNLEDINVRPLQSGGNVIEGSFTMFASALIS